jgi:hypothetical protein
MALVVDVVKGTGSAAQTVQIAMIPIAQKQARSLKTPWSLVL